MFGTNIPFWLDSRQMVNLPKKKNAVNFRNSLLLEKRLRKYTCDLISLPFYAFPLLFPQLQISILSLLIQ